MSARPSRRRKPPEPILLPSARRAQQQGRAQAGDSGANTRTDTPQAHAASGMGDTSAALSPLPLGQGVKLVAYHPCGLYVLDKPEGILSHPNRKSETRRSLLAAPYSLEQECYLLPIAEPLQHQHAAPAQVQPLYLLHRLDSATSGLLLLTDNPLVAERVREAFASGQVRKTYLALCGGASRTHPNDKGSWSDRLQRERSSGGDIIHVRAGQGLNARTDYLCRRVDPQTRTIALLELHPISGRTHQLRVHCAQHGLPIIGDGKYGDFRLNRVVAQASGLKRLFLHAARLSLSFEFQGQQIRLELESPLPPAFETLLGNAQLLARAATGGRSNARARK